eukprot:CAMPEP_0170945490 /NCGR_PEP_ID=MMETSP0735-20130129/26476_1 /TAXON_ID=186038 /ORGANISM="Fragilariopsis kerguelensis, Strain L26-C5" /LENGTH=112 /DNA_ID=CAMNT_0011353903 /DNA_START=51 /DNA_END=386 /DNA_ORIENTATION=-
MAIHRGRSMMILQILFIVSSMIVYSSAFGVGGLGQGSSAKNSPLFSNSASTRITSTASSTSTSLPMAAVVSGKTKKKVPYKPKWVKKQTLAESGGNVATLGEYNVGLKGAIP